MTVRSSLSSEVCALLESEREIPPVPAAQRARAIARAREALARPLATPARFSRAPARPRWMAAAAALVASAAVGAAAYELRAGLRPARPVPSGEAKAAPAIAAPPATPQPAKEPAPVSIVAAREPARPDTSGEELALLRQARAAVARGDFAGALRPITEDTRRFKNGRLVEEREALRVKVLVGLGRTEEARHAAAAFKARFPRSVLLPAVSRMLSSDR